MEKLKLFIKKIKTFVKKRPKILIPAAAVLFLLTYSAAECFRARIYLNKANEYKNSVEILKVKENAQRLINSTKDAKQAYYCQFDTGSLVDISNSANQNNNQIISEIVTQLRESAIEAQDPPSFNSLMQILPRVKEARNTSIQLDSSLKNIIELTDEDARSTYCLELERALSEVYFLSQIKTPQAVSALYVDQLEKFQIKVNKSQEILKKIKYPVYFEDINSDIYKLLETIKKDLREDENNYIEFSRRIEVDVENLDSMLNEISNRSADLQSNTLEISLYIDQLE